MKPEGGDVILEDWAFDRREAGHITGFSEIQITKMQNRYDLFDVTSQRRGLSISYRLSELLKLAAVRKLKDDGLKSRSAVESVNSFSIYGTLLHNGALASNGRPGLFILTWFDGRYVAMYDPQISPSHRIEVDTWALLDSILPRMIEIMRSSDRIDAENLERRLAAALSRIDEIRTLRHQG